MTQDGKIERIATLSQTTLKVQSQQTNPASLLSVSPIGRAKIKLENEIYKTVTVPSSRESTVLINSVNDLNVNPTTSYKERILKTENSILLPNPEINSNNPLRRIRLPHAQTSTNLQQIIKNPERNCLQRDSTLYKSQNHKELVLETHPLRIKTERDIQANYVNTQEIQNYTRLTIPDNCTKINTQEVIHKQTYLQRAGAGGVSQKHQTSSTVFDSLLHADEQYNLVDEHCIHDTDYEKLLISGSVKPPCSKQEQVNHSIKNSQYQIKQIDLIKECFNDRFDDQENNNYFYNNEYEGEITVENKEENTIFKSEEQFDDIGEESSFYIKKIDEEEEINYETMMMFGGEVSTAEGDDFDFLRDQIYPENDTFMPVFSSSALAGNEDIGLNVSSDEINMDDQYNSPLQPFEYLYDGNCDEQFSPTESFENRNNLNEVFSLSPSSINVDFDPNFNNMVTEENTYNINTSSFINDSSLTINNNNNNNNGEIDVATLHDTTNKVMDGEPKLLKLFTHLQPELCMDLSDINTPDIEADILELEKFGKFDLVNFCESSDMPNENFLEDTEEKIFEELKTAQPTITVINVELPTTIPQLQLPESENISNRLKRSYDYDCQPSTSSGIGSPMSVTSTTSSSAYQPPTKRRGRPPKPDVLDPIVCDESMNPEEVRYLEMRNKNNLASRRSRQNRKEKELESETVANHLEDEHNNLVRKQKELEKECRKWKKAVMRLATM